MTSRGSQGERGAHNEHDDYRHTSIVVSIGHAVLTIRIGKHAKLTGAKCVTEKHESPILYVTPYAQRSGEEYKGETVKLGQRQRLDDYRWF